MTAVAYLQHPFNDASLNACRLTVREHFTPEEWAVIPHSPVASWQVVYPLTHSPVEQFDDPVNIDVHRNDWRKLRYINCLAFYQRVRFPLLYTLSSNHDRRYFSVDELPNTQEL